MQSGKSWSIGRNLCCLLLALPAMWSATGCAKDHAAIERSLLAQPAQERGHFVHHYRVACPDVIELRVQPRDEFNGSYEVGSDGRIKMGEYGNPRVEGRTPREIAKVVAEEIGVSWAGVAVRVVEHRSQHVLVFGEVTGQQRRVPYCGPETALELLQRAGGITHGAAPDDVYIIRPHLGDHRRPEVFHVDLNAIVMKQDYRTNLRIEPFDQICVGETRRAKIGKALPPALSRIYQAISDTKPEPAFQR